jgi:energy-converting hydrogenase Eha subunit E
MALNTDNAFQLLTFIAAPALLTNASSVLVLSTSNRFARAVDRARALEALEPTPDHERALIRVARRALALNRALTAFYTAVASFAIGTFSELLGGGVAAIVRGEVAPVITMIGLAVATVGTIAIATGAAFLVAETWDAYGGLREEAYDLLHRNEAG